MKKLLLSSSVMFFLCSISFAQAKQGAKPSIKAGFEIAEKAQKEKEAKKLQDYQASQAKGFQKTEAQILADKQRTELLNADKVAQKAAASLVDPRSN